MPRRIFQGQANPKLIHYDGLAANTHYFIGIRAHIQFFSKAAYITGCMCLGFSSSLRHELSTSLLQATSTMEDPKGPMSYSLNS